MARQWDYDGNIHLWEEFGVLPETLSDILGVVKYRVKGRRVAVLGNGDGLIASALAAEGLDVSLFVKPSGISPQMANDGGDNLYPAYQAPLRPRTKGDYAIREVDPRSKEVFDFLGPDTIVVGRKSLQRCYSQDWMDRLNESGVELIVSEALQGGQELFRNAEIECAFLRRHGWTPHVTKGTNVIWATRDADEVSDSK